MQKTKLKTFSTLEDAIVELKDYVYATNNPNGKPIRKIYPARYDQPAINNIATQVNKGVPLTDKQQELAIKLVTKYRRQWKKLGIDVSNIDLDTPVKMPIRQDVDREHSVYVEEDRIQLKFPYKPKLIGHIAGHGEFSRGKVFWDKERKVWSISVTPDNVNWVKKFAKDHNFETTQSFNDLCKQVVEAFDFKDICLDLQDKQLILNNVPESMLDWIHKNIGRIEMKNFIKLVSYSYVLDYTLSESVVDYTVRNYPNTYRQILYRQSVINSNVETLRELLLKVKQLDFDNIVFYIVDKDEVDPLCRQIENVLPDYNINTVFENMVRTWSHSPYKTKDIIVTNKTLTTQPDLIISFAGFMAGPGRRDWFGNANKLIYYCADVDNKIKKTIKKYEGNLSNKRRN